jgi:PAS domain S-box-containing protein
MNANGIQVLLVEDKPADALIVRDELAHSASAPFFVAPVERLNEALSRLKAQRFDVVLLDLSLPDSHGFDTFVRLRAAAPEVPIVVLSGQAEEALALKAVQAGAQDYLVKGRIGEGVLQRSIRYAIERKRTERTLAESEERYRLLIENSPDSYLLLCEGKIVFANAASSKLFATDRADQLVARSIMDCVCPEFREVMRQRIWDAPADEPSPPLEVLCVRLDGGTVAVEATGNPFIHEGRPAVQLVLRDITSRKRAEERVREQASMLDQAHDAIIVRDIRTRRITFWNRGAECLYGWTAAEAIGSDAGQLVCIDPNVQDALDAELLKADEWKGEYRKVTKAGKKLTISGHATLVRDSEGAPKSALTIDIDITGHKDLEARFLRAQRIESIGTLASGVAHDLNNILAPIMMSAPILRQTDLSTEERERIIAGIEASAERGAQIVRQVLTFGRGLEGERRPLEVGALIGELLKIMQGTFPKDLRIDISLDPHLWPAIGDATQLHQILLNLCVNARDAMPDGGRLRLYAANVELDASFASMLPGAAPGPHILIEVGDSGTGIPPEILDRIFDPFFTTKGIGEGTGLGLSTVLGIVKSHGGFIHVNTQSGAGTTFQVYLPASPGDEALQSAPLREPVPAGCGELVLLVDDEEGVRVAARVTLETGGYRVLVAADGAEALALYAVNAGSVAAVLTDLMMPLMDGVAFIRALRTLDGDLPVIAVTGLGEKAQRSQLKAMGIKTILQKPFAADTLLRAVHGALHPPVASQAA